MNQLSILTGDCRDILPTLEAGSVQCCVTSPPYWGLRDYGISSSLWDVDAECEHEWGDTISVNATNHTDKRRWQHTRNGRDEEQPIEKRVAWLRTEVPQGKFCQKCNGWAGSLGLEPDPQLYIDHMVAVFREVWRVLRNDGTLWLNMGDCYAANGISGLSIKGASSTLEGGENSSHYNGRKTVPPGLKSKDLCMMPARLAMALQADGWYLRSEIVWHKPNPMPESVTDRPTKAHEMIYLLAKNGGNPLIWRTRDTGEWSYNPDLSEVIKIGKGRAKTSAGWDISDSAHDGIYGNYSDGKTRWREAEEDEILRWKGFDYFYDAEAIREPAQDRVQPIPELKTIRPNDTAWHDNRYAPGASGYGHNPNGRNKRSVWTIPTQPYAEAHFATFPEEIPKLCILAGSKPGDTILDPFFGSGTVGKVALELARAVIGIELNPQYVELARGRCHTTPGLPLGLKAPSASTLFDKARLDPMLGLSAPEIDVVLD
jgi:DNA modification methylase